MASRFRRRALAAPLAALLVTALTVMVALSAPRWAEQIDYWLFDRFQQAAPRAYDPDGPVRIIDIDSASLARIGQWPWPRTYVAEMVERLTALGAATIAFDLVFAEPDRTSPRRAAASWARFSDDPPLDLGHLPDHDTVLAGAIAGAPVVLGTILSRAAARPVPKGSLSTLGPPAEPHLPAFPGAEVNLPLLDARATGLASITLTERAGGIVRSLPLLTVVDGAALPGLAVEALRVAQAQPGYLVKTVGASGEAGFGAAGIVGLRVGAFEIPTRRDGALWLRYAGHRPARHISAAAILQDDWRALRPQIEGRILIVGASAPGLRDLIATPLSDNELGAAVHAEAVEQIIAQDFLTRPDWARGAEILMLVFGGGLMAVLAGAGSTLWVSLGALALVAACLAGGWIAFAGYSLLLSPFWPLAGGVLAWSAGSAVNYRIADRDKRQVRAQFSQFLAPEVVEEIAEHPDRYLTPGGEDREITILFVDVRRFSTLSRAMSSRELIVYLNDFLTPVSDAIVAQGGMINKYIGDEIMAFWNAPKPREDHRAKALDAILSIRAAVAALNLRHRAAGRPEIAFGAGVNCGICSVGAIGSYRRLDYTCIGDDVNTASRLEGLTKQYGLDACIAESVVAGADGHAVIELDRVEVVGREGTPERIYALFGDRAVAAQDGFRHSRATAADALALYRAGRFAQAAARFDTLGATTPALARYARTMSARASAFAHSPPPEGWDGVYRATVK